MSHTQTSIPGLFPHHHKNHQMSQLFQEKQEKMQQKSYNGVYIENNCKIDALGQSEGCFYRIILHKIPG